MSFNFVVDVDQSEHKDGFPVTIRFPIFFYFAFLELKKKNADVDKAFTNLTDKYESILCKDFTKGLKILLDKFGEKNAKALTDFSIKPENDPFPGGAGSCTTRINGEPVSVDGGVGKCEIVRLHKDETGNIIIDEVIDIANEKTIQTDRGIFEIIRKKPRKFKDLPVLEKLYNLLISLDENTPLKFCIS